MLMSVWTVACSAYLKWLRSIGLVLVKADGPYMVSSLNTRAKEGHEFAPIKGGYHYSLDSSFSSCECTCGAHVEARHSRLEARSIDTAVFEYSILLASSIGNFWVVLKSLKLCLGLLFSCASGLVVK